LKNYIKKEWLIKKKLSKYNILCIDNKEYDKKEMLCSLKLGILNCNGDVIIIYSDIIYSKNVFKDISKIKKIFCIPCNYKWYEIDDINDYKNYLNYH